MDYPNILKLPDDWPIPIEQTQRVVDSVPLGYRTAKLRHSTPRKPVDAFIHGPSTVSAVDLFAVWAACKCGARWREWRPTSAEPPDSECGPCPTCGATFG